MTEIEEDEVEIETSYHGNPNLKSLGQKHEFTQYQVDEIQKCIADPIYFTETYCKIVSSDHGLIPFVLYDCQKRKIETILGNRMVIIMEPRQNGKTVVAAACILWYTLFQDRKSVAVLANKKDGAYEVLDRYQIMYENLPIWMQQGVKTWNKGSVILENGSKVFTAATTSSGIRGKTVNWLYIDEAAIIPNNVAEQFFASAFPTISSGTTTKILMTSTPLGFNHFWKFWNEAKKGKNGFVPMFIPYWEIPGRDAAWAAEQKNRLGTVKYNQEVACEFLGSSNTLINAETLAAMSSTEPIHTSMNLDVYEEPQKGHTYVLTADTGRGVGGNFSAFSVVDVTSVPYKFAAKYRRNDIAPMLYPTAIHKTAKDYNDAYILVEINDAGGQIVDILYYEYEYENIISTVNEKGRVFVSPGFSKQTTLGVRTTKTVKRQGCSAIKSILEEHKMELFDAETIKEFSTFVEKNGLYCADEGYDDDLAMGLVLFGWLTTNQYFTELTDISIREKLYKEQMAQIEEEMTPFGLIDDGLGDEYIVEGGDAWKIVE